MCPRGMAYSALPSRSVILRPTTTYGGAGTVGRATAHRHSHHLSSGAGRGRRQCRVAGQRALVAHLAAAALGAPFMVHQVDRLTLGDDQQQTPEIVAIMQLREAALCGAAAEAVKGAESDIFRARHAARGAAELLAGQDHQGKQQELSTA